MEASTTIKNMISGGKKITVPNYQRAYSWETPRGQSSRKTHTDVFLSDLDEYRKSTTESPYYFGHFLFEEKGDSFYVIDGQQRLTTIVIFLSALFAKLGSLRDLSNDEKDSFEDMIKRRENIRFSTVDYDNQIFIDYVIDQTKQNHNGLDTESAKRIIYAFDYFVKQLADKDEQYLTRMLEIISKASCTTHPVKNESEAIQMFIFQNDRGKKPSNLEVIKAQFMYNLHLHGKEETTFLLGEVKNRFETIYKSISSIDYKIDEDDVLIYTLRVYCNSLSEMNPLDKINENLAKGDSISFIKEFSQALADSFENLKTFFGKDESQNHSIHSLVTLGGIGVVCPFIIKAYKFGLDVDTIGKLCAAFESLVLRHRLIGTRAEIATRINDVFIGFTETTKSIQPIIERVNMMRSTSDWWWAYWNNTELEKALQGGLNHSVAKFLLWKYENYLKSLQGKSGYQSTRYDTIDCPELEHIAPTTEPTEKPHGYDNYDEEFRSQYLNCLGNYLLLSKPHNCSIGNIPFSEKHKTYNFLKQQEEIQGLVPENGTWDRHVIKFRNDKISEFVIANL